MCRIEERIYVNAQGHQSKFEEAFPCDKAQKGRLCTNVKKRSTEYWPKKGSVTRDDTPSPINPPTPTGTGSYLVQQRRPSSSSGRPSTRDGKIGKIGEIIIEFGSKNRKNSEYSADSTRAEKGDSGEDADGEDHHYVADRSASSYASNGNSASSPLRGAQQQKESKDEEEKVQQGRFELGPVISRAKKRAVIQLAETQLAEREKQRAIDREEARRRYQRGREEAKRPSKPRSGSVSTTLAQEEQRRRPLALDSDHMWGESRAAEAREQERRAALSEQLQQDTSYYNPRIGGLSNALNPTLTRRNSTSLRDSFSYEARPTEASSLVSEPQPSSIDVNIEQGSARSFSTRTHAPPPLSFPSNFNSRPTAARRPLSSREQPFLENPFMTKASVISPSTIIHQDPWDARKIREALPPIPLTYDNPYPAARQATRVKDRSAATESDSYTESNNNIRYRHRQRPLVETMKATTATGLNRQSLSDAGVLPSLEFIGGSETPIASKTLSFERHDEEDGDVGSNAYDNVHSDSVVAMREVEWDHIPYGNRGSFVSSDSGSSISYANSVPSMASLASSATDVSKHSGYSAIQIAKATKELIVILQEDAALTPLYKRAIADVSIGSKKLERNLRRFFRNYADLLEKAAGETLELLASRLVKAKARAVAQSIIRKYRTDLTFFESNDFDSKLKNEREQSSDEEVDPYPVKEDAFEDLVVFREFLVGGEAFIALHSQIRSFVVPKSTQQEDILDVTNDPGSAIKQGELDRGDESSTLNSLETIKVSEAVTVDGVTSKQNAGSVAPYSIATRDAGIVYQDDLTHCSNTEHGISSFTVPAMLEEDCPIAPIPEQVSPVTAPIPSPEDEVIKVSRPRDMSLSPEKQEKETSQSELHEYQNKWGAFREQVSHRRITEQSGQNALSIDIELSYNKGDQDNYPSAKSNEEDSGTELINKGFFFFYSSTINFLNDFASTIMMNLGCLETPLQPGYTRLRWQCRCGDSFYGDVREIRTGGIAMLTEQMQRSTSNKIIGTSYNQGSANARYTFPVPNFARNVARKISTALGQTKDSAQELPQYTGPITTPKSASPSSNLSPQQSLHMMTCTRLGLHGYQLHQDKVHHITTDRELFVFMKKQFAKRCGYTHSWLSWKCVQDVYFRKFVYWGNSAEIREDGPSCPSSAPHPCDCIPPKTKVEPEPGAEYQCTPAGPPNTCPPVVSHQLMHWLDKPECILEGQTWVLNQLPKRNCGELQAKANQPAEGWGLLLKEGVDGQKVASMVFMVLAISLLFAIFYSCFAHDIQGGFGVSSYMVAAVAVPAALALNRVGKSS